MVTEKVLVVAAAAIAVAGCNTTAIPQTATPLTVSFDFAPTNRCSTVSPAIRVAGTPAGAVNYRVKMVDRNVPTFNHGGGTVPVGDGLIAVGALKSFRGPCPPSGQHVYEITVLAVDAAGAIVGAGSATRAF